MPTPLERRDRNIVTAMLIVLGSVVAVVIGFVVTVAVALTTFFDPAPRDIVEAAGIDCVRAETSTYLLIDANVLSSGQIQASDWAPRDSAIAGLAFADPLVPDLETLSYDRWLDLRKGAATTIVVRVDSPGQTGRMDTLPLHWSMGEPAFEQTIDIGATWAEAGCRVGS